MFLRALAGCLIKDLKSAWTEKSTLLPCITLPVNYLILLSLFALAGSNAPTAVVMQDNGPYARAFVQAMREAHSFNIRIETAQDAAAQYQAGTLVSVVTIPGNFETAMLNGETTIQIPFQINTINEDLTNDATRGMRLAVTTFYAENFAKAVTITVAEHDAYATTLGYLPYLSLSILVVALVVVGLLQAGAAAAREWEKQTIKELLLAPAPLWAIIAGKILSVFVIGLPALAVVLALVVCVVGWPANWLLVVTTGLLSLLVFSAAGCALGMAVKDRASVTILARAVAVPLLFLSGLFGPIGYSTGAIQILARLFPLHYAISLEQLAFKNFTSNLLTPWQNMGILASYTLVFVALAILATHLSKIEH
jgi:ABC-2 type transport system permease protein